MPIIDYPLLSVAVSPRSMMAIFEMKSFQISRDNVSPQCDLKKMDILIKERVMIPNSAIRLGEYTLLQHFVMEYQSSEPFDNAAILHVSKDML